MPNILVRRWNGSLVTALGAEETVPGDFAALDNFIFDADGMPVVRGGRRKWNDSAISANTISYLYFFQSGAPWGASASAKILFAYDGLHLYYSDGIVAFQQFPGSDLILGPRADLSFAAMQDKLFIGSSSTAYPGLHYIQGSAGGAGINPVVPSVPPPSIVASYGFRLWAVDRDDPSLLRFSAPNDPLLWSEADDGGFIYVGQGDGDYISALMPGFSGEMIIFKDGPNGGSTYRLDALGPAITFSLGPLSKSIGAISNRAVTQVGDRDIFFVSRRGIHSLARVDKYGDLESSFIDAEISNQWRGLPYESKKKAVAVDDYPHDTWWLFVDTNGDRVNDKGWLFNYQRRNARGNPSISTVSYGSHGATVFADPHTGRDTLITGGFDGFVRTEHHPEANDDGVDYDWSMQLSPLVGGNPFKTKSWRRLWLLHDNWGVADMTAEWWGDNNQPSSVDASMNPASLPTPFTGVRSGHVRGVPTALSEQTAFTMMEGGNRLNFKLSGSKGRIKLRGLEVEMDELSRRMQTPQYVKTARR